ncbi:MAG TPA: ABC transporter permease [Chitinophagaceae bacterium]|nr:ABC transporter permease [Chitinophagaceae bacterium]
MIKSYIKIAARSFSKNRLVSFINIFGLGLSMSVGMMVMIRMQDQFSYDNFHPHPGRTYRITSEYAKKNGEQWKLASTPLPINEALAKEKDNVESAVNIYPAFNGKAKVAGKEIYLNCAFTEPSFFDVFGFSLLSGDPGTALQLPNSIVINRSTAEKFFGKENPLGKVINMGNVGDFIIKGVLNDIPGKSHINYDAYASYSSVAQLEKDKLLPGKSSDWYAFNTAYTYVLLKKNVHTSALMQQLNFIANDLNKNNKEGTCAFNLQRIDRITPGSDYLNNDIGRGTSWGKIYFEIGMSLLILLAACFNYTNLTIARALTRAKEVGIRKIVGAKRFQVFTQYVIESVLLVLLALSFAWLILSFVIHYAPFNDDYEFIPSSFQYNIPLVFWSIGFALFTGILAGVAPAWILSSFKPLRVLKNLSTARILGKVSLQKVFIVFQYSLSLTIIIFLFAFYRQFAFMAKADPGFKKDNVMVLPLNGLDAKIATQKIGSVSGVTSVAAMSSDLGKRFQGMNAPVWISDKKNALPLNYYYTEESFIPSMKIVFVAGKNFTVSTKDDEDIILNEKAVRALGISKVENALGEKVWVSDSLRLEIIGVLKDFAYEGVGRPVAPLAFRNKKNAYNYLYVVAGNTDKKKLEGHIKQAWNTLAPLQPYSFSWLGEVIDEGNSQTATVSLLGYLAFIAMAIASLGLLGLVIYTIEVKRKEISIRKIIGANEKQLVKMLSQRFIKLIIIAGLIAMPLSYTAGFLFLQNFAYRIHFGLWNVLLCFFFLLSIGLFTIISQTYKAATSNPVKSLRTE